MSKEIYEGPDFSKGVSGVPEETEPEKTSRLYSIPLVGTIGKLLSQKEHDELVAATEFVSKTKRGKKRGPMGW